MVTEPVTNSRSVPLPWRAMATHAAFVAAATSQTSSPTLAQSVSYAATGKMRVNSQPTEKPK